MVANLGVDEFKKISFFRLKSLVHMIYEQFSGIGTCRVGVFYQLE